MSNMRCSNCKSVYVAAHCVTRHADKQPACDLVRCITCKAIGTRDGSRVSREEVVS